VAIVVDVRDITAAIRIFAKEDDGYIDGVGTEEAGNLVIVPWRSISTTALGRPELGTLQVANDAYVLLHLFCYIILGRCLVNRMPIVWVVLNVTKGEDCVPNGTVNQTSPIDSSVIAAFASSRVNS
jgi:hypothetical protein